ncbi:MAG: hypothetical protein ACC619_06720 [Paracoccaceae bacterium]
MPVGHIVPVFLLVFATAICVATAYSLRGNTAAGAPISFYGFDGIGVIAGFIAYVLITTALGTAFGISLLAALMLHELGHVLAYRMLGHQNTRFRLVPLISGLPISDKPLKTEGEVFFVALMGPGFSLAPMVLEAALSVYLAAPMPGVANYLRIFAIAVGTLNFVNLLPIWPLDGGRCARIAARNFWPALAPAMTVFISAALAAASLRTGSLALMVFAGVGALSLVRKGEKLSNPLGADTGLIALAAYTFTMAAHFLGGWTLLQTLF